MNVIATLEATLKAGRKTLSQFQTDHLNATITYLKGLKKDFKSAKTEYNVAMKKARLDH